MYDWMRGWRTIIREQPVTLCGALRLYDVFAYPKRRLTSSRTGIGQFELGESHIEIDHDEFRRTWGSEDLCALLEMRVEEGFFQAINERGILQYALANLLPPPRDDLTLVRFEGNKIHISGSTLDALALSRIVHENLDERRTSRSVRRFLRTCE